MKRDKRTEVISLRMTPAMLKQIDALATVQNRTRANMIEELLKRQIDKEKK